MENLFNSDSDATSPDTTLISLDGQFPTQETQKRNDIEYTDSTFHEVYEDETIYLQLQTVADRLYIHVKILVKPTEELFKHWFTVFAMLEENLVDRGFKELYTYNQDQSQEAFAEKFGFEKDYSQIIWTTNSDEPWTLMKKVL